MVLIARRVMYFGVDLCRMNDIKKIKKSVTSRLGHEVYYDTMRLRLCKTGPGQNQNTH